MNADTNATPRPWATDGRFIVEDNGGQPFYSGQPFIADCAISQSHRTYQQTEANAKLIVAAVNDFDRTRAKLSERKTVHKWLNAKGVPREEFGKPICLLRRLAIALKIHEDKITTRKGKNEHKPGTANPN